MAFRIGNIWCERDPCTNLQAEGPMKTLDKSIRFNYLKKGGICISSKDRFPKIPNNS